MAVFKSGTGLKIPVFSTTIWSRPWWAGTGGESRGAGEVGLEGEKREPGKGARKDRGWMKRALEGGRGGGGAEGGSGGKERASGGRGMGGGGGG